MTMPFEIRDRQHPEWRGQRFATLGRAKRELRRAEPYDHARFYLWDRENNVEIPVEKRMVTS